MLRNCYVRIVTSPVTTVILEKHFQDFFDCLLFCVSPNLLPAIGPQASTKFLKLSGGFSCQELWPRYWVATLLAVFFCGNCMGPTAHRACRGKQIHPPHPHSYDDAACVSCRLIFDNGPLLKRGCRKRGTWLIGRQEESDLAVTKRAQQIEISQLSLYHRAALQTHRSGRHAVQISANVITVWFWPIFGRMRQMCWCKALQSFQGKEATAGQNTRQNYLQTNPEMQLSILFWTNIFWYLCYG